MNAMSKAEDERHKKAMEQIKQEYEEQQIKRNKESIDFYRRLRNFAVNGNETYPGEFDSCIEDIDKELTRLNQ